MIIFGVLLLPGFKKFWLLPLFKATYFFVHFTMEHFIRFLSSDTTDIELLCYNVIKLGSEFDANRRQFQVINKPVNKSSPDINFPHHKQYENP